MTKTDPIIMITDDDPDDRLLTREAFNENNIANTLIFTEDGEDLMDYLFKRNKYEGLELPIPDIILLDLNMPKKDGREVLTELKTHLIFKRIPVVVLTTSKSEEDIAAAYDLGGNSFITKPVTYDSLVAAVKEMGNYWFKLVSLPTVSNAV
jgi:CheY-like chemotaxis protein